MLRLSRPFAEAGPATPACLDAVTAADWVARRLPAPAFESAKAHVVDCARCQMLLGELLRADGPFRAEPPHTAERWYRSVGALAVGAVGVVAGVLWIAMPGTMNPRVQPAAPAVQLEAVPPQERQAPTPRVGPSFSSGDVAARPPAFPQPSDVAARPPAVPAPRIAIEPRRRTETPVPSPIAPAPRPADATFNRIVYPPEPNEVVSPDPLVRWRIVVRGIERSTDGGGTWTPVPTGISGAFTAGTAPSTAVCWLVGREGLVALSNDGAWRSVAFPAAVDLVNVQAGDARTASVRAADGRTFRTSNGGETWVEP